MIYLGDYAEDATIDFKWSTNDVNGASITRATDGTVSVYKANGTTQSTAGITDTEDFDGLTGVHHCRIDTSADAFYATGNDYQVVLSAATIDGQTVNAVLAHFSTENRFDPLDATNAELSSIPSTTGTLRSMLQFLFQYFRNKRTVTGSTETMFKEDASTTLGTATLSDDGSTFGKGEMG